MFNSNYFKAVSNFMLISSKVEANRFLLALTL